MSACFDWVSARMATPDRRFAPPDDPWSMGRAIRVRPRQPFGPAADDIGPWRSVGCRDLTRMIHYRGTGLYDRIGWLR